MNIWAKIITAIRGGATEAGEALIDTQALRILDQEVRDASEQLKESKNSLANIMAKQKVAEDKVAQFKKDIKEHEDYAVKALAKDDEVLALEVAEKIADLQVSLSDESAQAKTFKEHVEKLKATILQTERNIKRLKQQVDTVKATESLQQAQNTVAERYTGSESRLHTAMDSLERIKEKQALKAAKINAAADVAKETGESSLEEKLLQAGIVSNGESAQDILDRLAKKKASKRK